MVRYFGYCAYCTKGEGHGEGTTIAYNAIMKIIYKPWLYFYCDVFYHCTSMHCRCRARHALMLIFSWSTLLNYAVSGSFRSCLTCGQVDCRQLIPRSMARNWSSSLETSYIAQLFLTEPNPVRNGRSKIYRNSIISMNFFFSKRYRIEIVYITHVSLGSFNVIAFGQSCAY